MADVLMQAGYAVPADKWGLHNTVISSIRRGGVEHIPETRRHGHDDPRDYLPANIIALLDAKQPVYGEAQQ